MTVFESGTAVVSLPRVDNAADLTVGTVVPTISSAPDDEMVLIDWGKQVRWEYVEDLEEWTR